MKHFLRVLAFVKPYLGYVATNVLFNVLYVLFSLVSLTMVVPFLGILFGTEQMVYELPEFSLSAEAAEKFLYYHITQIVVENGQKGALAFICVLVLVAFFLRNITRYFGMFFMTPIRHGVIYDMRNAVYRKLIYMPMRFFSDYNKGDLISRMTSDVAVIQQSIMSSLGMLVREPLTIISYLATLIIISPKLTLIAAILFPVSGVVIGRVGKSLKRASTKTQRQNGKVLSHLEEIIGGLRIIKGFTAEEKAIVQFDKISYDLKYFAMKMLRRYDLASPISEFLSTGVLVAVMWMGGQMVIGSIDMTPQVFIGYIIIFSQIITPVKALTSAYYSIQKGNASAERVLELLDAENNIVDKPDAKELQAFNEGVVFKDLSFAYENKAVLKDINFSINKGKTIALVGPSGSGKSTLADLVCRFYDTDKGGIYIDGVDIRDYKMKDIRGLMGIVSQESILFNDTIANNIALDSDKVDLDKVVEAAKVANAHEFILDKEGGYDFVVGERGGNLSGGQRQRLSIARAVYKNPPILILDEATSALDTESEKLVQEAIEGLMKNRTSLVIAHRLSTIQNADEIIVLQEGEIVERGNHLDLYEKGGLYRKLCDLQSFS